MVSRNIAKPLYIQIAEEIRSAIRSGKYPPSSLIPSESLLIEQYKVGRVTIRQALDVLVNEKLVTRKQGLGTFVSTDAYIDRIDQELCDLKTITEVLLAKGVQPRIKVVSFKVMLPPERVRLELNLPQREEVVGINRLYLIRRSPLCLVRIYLPLKFKDILEPLKQTIPLTETTYTIFERAGVKLHEARHVIKSISANQDTAKWLKVQAGTPILSLERTTYLKDGTPLEFIFFQYRADKFEFSIKVPRKRDAAQGLMEEVMSTLNHQYQIYKEVRK